MRYFRNQRRTLPPMVREVAKRSTERVAGLIPFGDATEDPGGGNAKSSPGEGDRLIEAVSVLDVAPVAHGRRGRGSRTKLLDHGRDLTGLRGDDHDLYFRHDGGRALSGDVRTGGQYRYFGRGVGGSLGAILGLEGTEDVSANFVHIISASQPWAPSIVTAGYSDNIGLIINPKGSGKTKIYDLEFAGTVTWTGAQHDHEDAAGGGTLDHGLALTGLADDDHTQYLLADGTRDVTGNMLFSVDNELQFRNTDIGFLSPDATTVFVKAPTGAGFMIGGALSLIARQTYVVIGSGAAGVDYYLHFDGETNNGKITFMEDEARFDFDQDVDVAGDITLTGTVDGRNVSVDGGVLDTALQDVVDDTSPELGGEMDAGAHTIGFTQQTATGDGTTTIDWKLGNKFKFTFGAQNDTFTFTAPSNPCNILLMLVQDGGGSRLATWPGTVKWPDGVAPTLSTGAADIDIVAFYYDGTNYYGGILQDFS